MTTLKDDIDLVREFVERGGMIEAFKQALDRIEAALTPSADRQAALDALTDWEGMTFSHSFDATNWFGLCMAEHAKTIHAALSEPAPVKVIPDGFVLVPKEPTDEMIDVEKLKREAGAFICGEYTSDRIDYCPDCRTVDKIIDYIASRNLLGGVPQWNTDMDSAPKDKHILVMGGRYDTDDQSDGMHVDDDVVYQVKHLIKNVWRTQYGYNIRNPTHWMLLPAAPSGEKVGG